MPMSEAGPDLLSLSGQEGSEQHPVTVLGQVDAILLVFV